MEILVWKTSCCLWLLYWR